MTVMYKKKAVLDAGNYQSCPLMEDSYLWARMILNRVQCANIGESLVYARIGKDMFNRRGGLKYLKKYREGRKMILQTGFINYYEYIISVLIQSVVALMPQQIRGFIFKHILHPQRKII